MLTYEQKIDILIDYMRLNDEEFARYLDERKNKTNDRVIPETHEKSLDIIIRDVLLADGIRPSLAGFRYLVVALKLIVSNRSYYLTKITCRLYPEVAKIMDTTKQRVESAIRHAIVDKGCSNKEFLANMAMKIEDAMMD